MSVASPEFVKSPEVTKEDAFFETRIEMRSCAAASQRSAHRSIVRSSPSLLQTGLPRSLASCPCCARVDTFCPCPGGPYSSSAAAVPVHNTGGSNNKTC